MVDYKEVEKKNGQRIVFCRLPDLLMEAFSAPTVDSLEPHANSVGEYVCHCPFCKAEGHTKKKLYVKKDFSVGHCFVCGRAYINVDDDINVNYTVPDFFRTPGKLELVRLADEEWSLDKFYNEFDDFSEKGYEYLIGRHKYMAQLWKLLEFKFFDGNIVMPFKYHQEIFYYQIRFTGGDSNFRYFFPPMPAGTKPPYIIENGDCKKFIICEGVYDAISLLIQAPGYTPFAVLGSCITSYQIQFLREYVPDKILIYMDDTEKSIGIAKTLKPIIDYCPIGIIKSDGTDPEERMKLKMERNQLLQWIN